MKINQLKTTTDRKPSILPTSTKFAPFVWLQLIEKNTTGLTYTQKKFLEMIIKNRLNKASISLSQYCISVYDITQDIHLYYARLHKLINNYNTIESSDAIAKIINCNPAMLSPKSGVIRPQKIIRLAMSPILTERQIRKLSSQFKHLDYIIHNTSTTYGSTNSTPSRLKNIYRIKKRHVWLC